MRQDKDLIERILVAMVNSEQMHLGTRDVHRLIGAEDSKFEVTRYHVKLLEDEGFIVLEEIGQLSGYRVTARGQERYEWYENNQNPFAT